LGACAIKSDGSIYCWGRNSNAELGIGAANSDNGIYPNPVLLTEKAVFKSIEAGEHNYCALSHDAEVWCWGRNDYGQAGFDDSVVNILKPQKNCCFIRCYSN
jgi:alpha-tubulin suppressor-like RCC1 family protein